VSPEDLINQLSGPLSLPRRIATVVALLGGLTVAAVVGLLWATEPGLPPRTQLAFGVLVAGGLAWVAYGVWALTRRTPLFALDRVIAAWLALVVTGLLTTTVAVITILRQHTEPVAFGAIAVLFVGAIINLVRAQARRTALLRRKRELGG
jgi:hypothetical protein